MARITRTQKYAELRNQLENNRETQIETKDLSETFKKLDELNIETPKAQEEVKSVEPVVENIKISDISDFLNEEVESVKEVEEVKEEAKEEVKPVTHEPVIEDEIEIVPVEELVRDLAQHKQDTTSTFDEVVVEDIIEPIAQDVKPVIEETPVVEEVPTVEETPIIEEPVIEETPIIEESTTIEEPVIEETPVVEEVANEEPIVETKSEDSFDSFVPFSFGLDAEEETKVEETPVVEEPVIEETPIIEEVPTVEETPIIEEPVIEETVEELPTIEPIEVEEAPEIKPIVIEEETPVVEEPTIKPIVIEEEAPVVEEPAITPIVIEEEAEETPVQPIIEEPVVAKEEPIAVEEITIVEEPTKEDVIDDKYLEETLNEVKEYNKSQGLVTADEVPGKIVDEIRGITNDEDLNRDDQEELSNTINLEIKRVLGEIEAAEEEHPVQAQVDPSQAEEEVTKVVEKFVEEETPEEEIEHTKVIEDINKEIKSVKDELKAETATTPLLNETMPYEVSKDEEDDDEEEYDEQPNRILNFILVVLIIVLLCILGFIGYLILVAQGIL